MSRLLMVLKAFIACSFSLTVMQFFQLPCGGVKVDVVELGLACKTKRGK